MQTSLFGREDDRQNQGLQLSPAEKWDMDAAKHSLDELFKVSSQYRTSDSYMRMLDFINQFPYIAPFNAMLAHIQMPGARYVLPPRKMVPVLWPGDKIGSQADCHLAHDGPGRFRV